MILHPAPLGLYLHVPFCKHACPYCDFYKMELRDRPARTRLDYPQKLGTEYGLLLAEHPELAERPPASIYFGGGTPSVLSPAAVCDLIAAIRVPHPASKPEVTLEANPENLTPARCEAWRATGVTRLSIGAQSFQERDLRRLERLHDAETIRRAVANARAAGIDNLSIDLMFGLPQQTLEEWMENLREAVALAPQHLSFYGLTIHEHTPFWEERKAGKLVLPGEEIEAEMYLRGAEYLVAHGFEHYEISNFAQPGWRSVHNQRYWRAEDVVGIGPGAHSCLGVMRWRNNDDLDAWEQAIAAQRLPRTAPERLAAREQIEEEIFRRMRTSEGFARDSPTEADRLFLAWLEGDDGQAAREQRWIAEEAGRVRLTAEGWLVSDALLLNIVGAGRNSH